MTFNEYQLGARGFAVYPNVGENLIYPVLGLVGEAGELANKVKKIQRDSGALTDEIRSALISELGDVLWYVAAVCGELGVRMGDVAEANLSKLAGRLERGTLRGSGDRR